MTTTEAIATNPAADGVTVKRINAALGAEVWGIDLKQPLSVDQIALVRSLLLEHLVLVFRGQHLNEDQHLAFGRQFGELHMPSVPTKHGGPPEINVLDQVHPEGDGADRWHSDNTYIAVPPMGSLLKAVKVPSVGGDTCFANMYMAYDRMSEPMKRYVEGLTAIHDVTVSLQLAVKGDNSDFDIAEMQRKLPPVEQPVVRTHPETGRKLLYVNVASTSHLVGVDREESEWMLPLYAMAHSPMVQCRVQWQEGDIVFFDNRCTQHYVVPDYNERRVMHRATIVGTRPY